MDNHLPIREKLAYFLEVGKIPHILFHGPPCGGKRSLLQEFLLSIYKNTEEKRHFVMEVDCSYGKGIKFIREDLKFFAKTHINSNDGHFKSIVLYNADKLTVDAQSVLRRCIELFSHTTRFFIVTQNKYGLMKPIISRFCEIYVCSPTLIKPVLLMSDETRRSLQREITKIDKTSCKSLLRASERLVDRGYSAHDILELLSNPRFLSNYLTPQRRYDLLFSFNQICREIRNEKMLIYFIFHCIFISLIPSLENISFI